jgi:hypothetical protein
LAQPEADAAQRACLELVIERKQRTARLFNKAVAKSVATKKGPIIPFFSTRDFS